MYKPSTTSIMGVSFIGQPISKVKQSKADLRVGNKHGRRRQRPPSTNVGFPCPLYPQEQTFAVQHSKSVMGQKRTCDQSTKLNMRHDDPGVHFGDFAASVVELRSGDVRRARGAANRSKQ